MATGAPPPYQLPPNAGIHLLATPTATVSAAAATQQQQHGQQPNGGPITLVAQPATVTLAGNQGYVVRGIF